MRQMSANGPIKKLQVDDSASMFNQCQLSLFDFKYRNIIDQQLTAKVLTPKNQTEILISDLGIYSSNLSFIQVILINTHFHQKNNIDNKKNNAESFTSRKRQTVIQG